MMADPKYTIDNNVPIPAGHRKWTNSPERDIVLMMKAPWRGENGEMVYQSVFFAGVTSVRAATIGDMAAKFALTHFEEPFRRRHKVRFLMEKGVKGSRIWRVEDIPLPPSAQDAADSQGDATE